MADEKDGLDIELEDIKVPDDEIVIEEPKPDDKNKAGSVEEELENLKRQVENERSGRATAEQRAAEATNVAVQRSNETATSNLHLVTNAISTLNMQQDTLENELAQALMNNDGAAAASAQRSIAENAAKLQVLEQGKLSLEAQPVFVAPPPVISDPVEALATQMVSAGSPRSADWVRQHPEYSRDPRLYQKMVAAHILVTADGLQADTQNYFDAIEDILKIRPAESDTAPQRRAAPAAAPVSRSGTADGTQRNRVTLSAAEVEMAEMMQMSAQEYAKHKLALRDEGKLH